MVMCRCFPHGRYGLLITVLTTCGWIASFLDDSCNYSIVKGNDMVSIIAGINATTGTDEYPPYLQVGFRAYRIPSYNPISEDWEMPGNAIDRSNPFNRNECLSFPPDTYDIVSDEHWRISKLFSFFALILGGGATMYLWFSTLCVFSASSWRWAGLEIIIASMFQMMSLLFWFKTDLCNYEPDVATDDLFTDLTTTTCQLSIGSKGDIAATVLWFVSGFLLCVYYPKPPTFDQTAAANSRDGISRTGASESSMTRSIKSSSSSTTIGSVKNNKDNSSARSMRSVA